MRQWTGHILSRTRIAVDWWASDNTTAVSHYFCSHVKSDNITGLSERWTKPIHCSPITGALLRQVVGINPSLIVILHPNQPTIISDETTSYTVTTLDSNHCPGSVMFLFEGSAFGRILYTGNFRWYEGVTVPLIHRTIDHIYFDNTYSRKSTKFISRDQCKVDAVRLVQSHLADDRVVYFVLDTFGMEDVLSYVAEMLQIKIVVHTEKFLHLTCMGIQHNFTTVPAEGGTVFHVTKNKLNYKKAVEKITSDHAPKQVAFVKISGMRRGQNCKSFDYINFSDHSTMQEIETFFMALRYKTATPIVNKTVDLAPKTPRIPTKGRKRKNEKEGVRLKLRKVAETEPAQSPAVSLHSPAYKVVTCLNTDEEAGSSPDVSLMSPTGTRLCSTPIPHTSQDMQQFRTSLADITSDDPNTSNWNSTCSSPATETPYIQPPVALDWLPSPIKTVVCTTATPVTYLHPIFQYDKMLCNVDILNKSASNSSPINLSFERDLELDRLMEEHDFSDMKPITIDSVLSPQDIKMICTSPIYDTGGKKRFISMSPTVEKENKLPPYDTDDAIIKTDESRPSNMNDLYEDMFRETECDADVNLTEDSIEVLNSTPDSIDTLYVSGTDEESDTDEPPGPFAENLRGQYALNQIFNNTILNIRKTLASTIVNQHKRIARKSSEDDLVLTRLELILPKVKGSTLRREPQSPKKTYTKSSGAMFFSSPIKYDPSYIPGYNKEEHFQELSEIAERGKRVTYRSKMARQPSSEAQTKTLFCDSMNLINDYPTTQIYDEKLSALVKLINTEGAVIPKKAPILKLVKRPLTMSGPYYRRIEKMNIFFSPIQLDTPKIQKFHKIYSLSSPKLQEVAPKPPIVPKIPAITSIPRIINVAKPKSKACRPPSSSSSSTGRSKHPKEIRPLICSNKSVEIIKPAKHMSVKLSDDFSNMFGSTPTSSIKKVKQKKKRTKLMYQSPTRTYTSH